MQTQSIQLNQLNKQQPPKSAPLPNDDFKETLSREMERAPVCSAPEQPVEKTALPAKARPAQPAKPAQGNPPARTEQQTAAQGTSAPADGAADTAAAAPGSGTPPAATAKPAGMTDDAVTEVPGTTVDPAASMLAMLAAYQPAPASAATAEQPATEAKPEVPAVETAAPADAAASMLAMLAAYQHLSAEKPAPPQEPAAPDTDSGTLAALSTDTAASRPTLEPAGAELAAEANGRAASARTDGTSALQQAQAERAGAELAKPLDGNERALAASEHKAEAFAAKLAEATPAQQPALPPAAQALAATVQAAETVAANQLQARVGTNAWEQQLGQKVVWMVAGGDQSASLTLNPPDLGPLQVVLNVSNDSASASFTAANPETRQAIENALPKLRDMMSEAGIELGNATVSAGTQDQQQAFAEQARRGGGGRGAGNGGGGAAEEATQPVIRRAVLGAVDTFA